MIALTAMIRQLQAESEALDATVAAVEQLALQENGLGPSQAAQLARRARLVASPTTKSERRVLAALRTVPAIESQSDLIDRGTCGPWR